MFKGEQTVNLTNFMNNVNNIISIDCIHVGLLLGFRRISVSSVEISESLRWRSIDIKIPARLTVSDKIEDGVRLHTAQLVFRTCEDIHDFGRWVYRCHTADGQSILIGSPERPYPVSNVTRNHPDNMTDSQLNEVSVSWVTPHEIPYII